MATYPANNKIVANTADIAAFIDAVEHDQRRADAKRLIELFAETTGWDPVMWGTSMIGFGRYHYVYESGREGDSLATGFSPRKSNLSIYIMPGYTDFGPILDRLGKHSKGKACLYVKKLADVDEAVLKELIQAGLADLAKKWEVHPV